MSVLLISIIDGHTSRSGNTLYIHYFDVDPLPNEANALLSASKTNQVVRIVATQGVIQGKVLTEYIGHGASFQVRPSDETTPETEATPF